MQLNQCLPASVFQLRVERSGRNFLLQKEQDKQRSKLSLWPKGVLSRIRFVTVCRVPVSVGHGRDDDRGSRLKLSAKVSASNQRLPEHRRVFSESNNFQLLHVVYCYLISFRPDAIWGSVSSTSPATFSTWSRSSLP